METKRTRITPLEEKHVEDVLEMYFEPDSWKYIKPHEGKDESYYRTFLNGKIEKNENEIGFWVVFSKEGKFIGTINLNNFMDEAIIHMGVHLRRDIWGKGFATELMQRLLNYAQEEKQLSEVYAIIAEGNHASIKIFEKLGFSLKDKREVDGEILRFYSLQF
ncbi:MAG: GNAT family N-acetyltransferase [Crocinitomicaceae bacterium]|nr:GNAT family N-acetyltransferase [Crocinitomicaceae bacterium]